MLAAQGIAVFVHEWRGNGSSTQRAGRRQDWGYRELLGTILNKIPVPAQSNSYVVMEEIKESTVLPLDR